MKREKVKKLIVKPLIVVLFGCLLFIYLHNNVIVRSSNIEKNISQDALHYANTFSGINNDPVQFALHYLYYNTDYQDTVPERIIGKIKNETSTEITVEIFDPNCQDDAIKSTKDIITLSKSGNVLIPVKHNCIIKYRPGYN